MDATFRPSHEKDSVDLAARAVLPTGQSPAPSSLAWIERFCPGHQLIRGRTYYTSKRDIGIILVLLALPFLGTAFVLCAIVIKIESPGDPVMFTQARIGKGGRRFRMYKFLSMVPNAEALKVELMHLNELQWPDF